MNISQATLHEASSVASALVEAAEWLHKCRRPLWSPSDFTLERVSKDIEAGLFHVAREQAELAGVVKIELEDYYFWPEIAPGTSAYIHKLAVCRNWAGKGVSAALLDYAKTRSAALGLAHLRLDCVADRVGLRKLYDEFGFTLHSIIQKGGTQFARYELPVSRYAVMSALGPRQTYLRHQSGHLTRHATVSVATDLRQVASCEVMRHSKDVHLAFLPKCGVV